MAKNRNTRNKNNGRYEGLYKEEYVEEVDKYLASREDKIVRVARKGIRKTGKHKGGPYTIYDTKFKVQLPTIYGFARHLGFSKKTLNNWGKAHKDFQVALDKVKSEQMQRLIDRGLSGDYNSAIAKLILSTNHGMKDKVDTTSGDEPINSFNDEQIDKIADRIARRRSNDGDTSSKEKSN